MNLTDYETIAGISAYAAELMTQAKERSFHKQRRMFFVRGNGTPVLSPVGLELSHAEWMNIEYGIPDANYFLRGYFDATGLYYYRGELCTTTEEDDRAIQVILPTIIMVGPILDLNIPLYSGVVPGQRGERWIARQKIGNISDFYRCEERGSCYFRRDAMPRRPEQLQAIDAVLAERDMQDGRWGSVYDDQHSEEDWTDLANEYLHGNSPRTASLPFIDRMTKVAAIAVAALESKRRKKNAEAVYRS